MSAGCRGLSTDSCFVFLPQPSSGRDRWTAASSDFTSAPYYHNYNTTSEFKFKKLKIKIPYKHSLLFLFFAFKLLFSVEKLDTEKQRTGNRVLRCRERRSECK